MTNANVDASAGEGDDKYAPSPMILKLRREKCQHLRNLVEDLLTTDALREWTTDAQIVRFLKATGWDLAKSAQRLRDTLAWRASRVGARGPSCSLCERNPHAHNLYHCGFDKAGCPVIYSSFGRAHERGNCDGNVEHLISTLDRLLKVMPVDLPGYLWVCDFEGFGFSDCNLGLIMQCVEIFGKHYPETLAGIYVVGAPRLWDLFWPTLNAAIKMSFATVAKVHFVKAPDGSGAGDHFRQTFMGLFDEEFMLWFIEEMNENRDGEHDLRGPLAFRSSAAAKVCWGLLDALPDGSAARGEVGVGGGAGGAEAGAATAEEGGKGRRDAAEPQGRGEAKEEEEGSSGQAAPAAAGEEGGEAAASGAPRETTEEELAGKRTKESGSSGENGGEATPPPADGAAGEDRG